jgi:hypothetical protein
MEAMQAEPIADGKQPMTSADVVSKVLYLSQGKPPSQASRKKLFFEECWYPEKLHQSRDIGGDDTSGVACW